MRSLSINEKQVHAFVEGVFGEELHSKRVLSLALATLGVIHAASLSVYAIGQALAQARGTQGKHGVKQVDRLLSNTGLSLWELFALWVPFVLGQRTQALVNLDWTDFEADDHTTLVVSLVTGHGRSTPLVWLTVQKSLLQGMRNEVEDAVLVRLRECIPSTVQVTVLADRGFADQKLYALFRQLPRAGPAIFAPSWRGVGAFPGRPCELEATTRPPYIHICTQANTVEGFQMKALLLGQRGDVSGNLMWYIEFPHDLKSALSQGLAALRAKGYWASAFPEGDGITFRKDPEDAVQALTDFRACLPFLEIEAAKEGSALTAQRAAIVGAELIDCICLTPIEGLRLLGPVADGNTRIHPPVDGEEVPLSGHPWGAILCDEMGADITPGWHPYLKKTGGTTKLLGYP